MNKSRRPQAKPKKLKRTLPGLLAGWDRVALVAELTTFRTSRLWEALKAAIAEEAFKHESAMRTFVRKTGLASEASYSLGATESMEWVAEKMIDEYLEFLKSGQSIGVSEDARPDEEASIPPGEGQIP